MSLSRILFAAGAATVLVAAPAALPAASAAGSCATGIGIGLVDVPVTKDPRANTYIIDHVQPGAKISRRFRACNGTTQPVTLQLYPGAAVIDKGAFTVVEGRADNELSRWMAVSPTTMTLAPGQSQLATASITVPANATSGERYAVILAELPAKSTAGVSVAGRVGVRVYLDVGGPVAPKSDFVIDSLQAGRTDQGLAFVTASVRNIGARALDMRGSLRLTEGPGGLSAGPFPANLGTTLAPGQTEPVTVLLSKAITGGPWLATLSLKSGLLEHRAAARITFPEQSGAQATPVKAKDVPLAKDRKVLIPIAGGLIFLLLLILIVTGYLSSRRRAREEESIPVTP